MTLRNTICESLMNIQRFKKESSSFIYENFQKHNFYKKNYNKHEWSSLYFIFPKNAMKPNEVP